MTASCSQSSVGGQGANNFKIDVGSPLQRHTTRISQVSGGGSYLWKCNVCESKPFNSSYSRVKLHFMCPSGKGMGMCKGSKNGKGMSNAQITSFIKEQKETDKLVNRSKKPSYQSPSGKKKMQLPNEPVESSKHPFLQVPISEVEEEEEIPPAKEVHWPRHLKWRQESLLIKPLHVASMPMVFLSTW